MSVEIRITQSHQLSEELCASGFYPTVRDTATIDNIKGIEKVDFDHDGNLDLLVLLQNQDVARIYFYKGYNNSYFYLQQWRGPYGWWRAHEIILDTTDPQTFTSGDFNEDGYKDLIVGAGTDGDTWLYKGDGTVDFKLIDDEITPITKGLSAFGMPFDFNEKACAVNYDFDNDFHKDLIAVNGFGQELYYINGYGNGTFDNPVVIFDGLGDVFRVSVPFEKFVPYTELPIVSISTPGSNHFVKAQIDIIGTVSDTNLLYYELRYGKGSVPLEWNVLISGSNNFTNQIIGNWDTSGLNGLYTLKLVAVDKDYNLNGYEVNINIINSISDPSKFILVGTESGKVYYLEDYKNGKFGIPTLIAQFDIPINSIGIGDFDNDNDYDFIIGNNSTAFINDGNNVFVIKNLDINSSVYDIEVVDINNDGLLDFMTGIHAKYSGLQDFYYIYNGV